MTTHPLHDLTLADLLRRTSMKWQAHGDDVLPLWVAEMDVRLAEPIAERLIEAIEEGDTGYPAGNSYGESVSRFAAEEWGWAGLDPNHTTIVPDVMLGIVEVLKLITEPGDTVVVNTPVYAPFFAFVEHAGRRILTAPLDEEGRIDLSALEAAFRTARVHSSQVVFLMSNPHNPTGVVHTQAELEGVAIAARRWGVRVVADEIHAPLMLEGATFTPYLSVAGSEDAFSLTSASKAWNLAGLKAAIVVAGDEAIADLLKMPEEVSHGPSHLGIMAHVAAFDHGRPWLNGLLADLSENRRLLTDLLEEHLPMASWVPTEGTYLAWLDFSSLDLDEPDADSTTAVVSDMAGTAQFFLDEARVALSSGHVFGPGGRNHVRLNFATHPDILTEAVERMAQAVHRAL